MIVGKRVRRVMIAGIATKVTIVRIIKVVLLVGQLPERAQYNATKHIP